ncbi:zinc finger protein DPF3 isoform X1 [Nematostella vectensis]|uniref:zinc finger protein DPF3 isoform X1 n=1 Tax=Nematostella vectensis TaxID=45351 RepID=UPI00138FBD1C|nr:zinc finger protein DPF3 isoform X1 [Nematostella vectensis]
MYRDALDNVSAFNAKLCFERKMRAPFLDAQTGIAMNNCNLWLSKFMRREPESSQYIYTYPARRWRKKKRVYQPEKSEEEKGSLVEEEPSSFTEAEGEQALEYVDSQQMGRAEEFTEEDTLGLEASSDLDEDVEEQLSSDDEEVELGKRRRGRPGRKKGYGSSSQLHTVPRPSPLFSGSMIVRNITKEELARMTPEDRKKPYVCEICGRRYKNGPGLKYHYTHYNHDQDNTSNAAQDDHSISLPSTPAALAVDSPKAPSPMPRGPGRPRRPDMQSTHSVTPNSYCDFCLGDVSENKKSGRPEELLSCSDCGRSGHPSCLQFTPKLTYNVKKYRWQCIECKSCTLCGTSDNDDQLLFCDDCDRGYHMYCLNPPMDKPPEGHWMCSLCRQSTMPPFMQMQMMHPSATPSM